MERIKSISELKEAIKQGKKLIWNDPDPIPNNDYDITFIEDINDDFDEYTGILIQYGYGSEAEVYLHEILIK